MSEKQHKNKVIKVIGAGLAGTETAWQLAESLQDIPEGSQYKIQLWEMRPKVKTPAHHTANFAELVCSNSLGSEFLTTARGVLINEMQAFNSLIISAAKEAKVPAGQALAVDRDVFADKITSAIKNHPLIEIINKEYSGDLLKEEGILVIATGPLTSPALSEQIQKLLKQTNSDAKSEYLHFFDAAAPIVNEESINMDIAFKASRYDKGDSADYINCPFYSKEEYEKFHQELVNAERAPLKDFEKESMRYFEGCMPVEAIAERGEKTLTFGPLKPVGLSDSRYPDKKAYAVVQLRQDNVAGSLYNLVGFQTNLKWGEQKRVFSMIPGLEKLDIVRYGVMHQNIFINSPLFLDSNLRLIAGPRNSSPAIWFSGQITGVEGYTESAATGIVVARSIIAKINNKNIDSLPKETMLGALSNYVAHAEAKRFQPINSNWGLINTEPENLDKKYRKNKKLRYEFLAERALSLIRQLKPALV